MLKLTTRLIGKRYEQQAEHFLQQQGLTSLVRNYQCRFGEIDLIMQQAQTLVFVEVRYRNSNTHGSAAETVTRSKQQKLLRTAGHFLAQQPQYRHMNCRFDIIGISHKGADIQWLQHAFTE